MADDLKGLSAGELQGRLANITQLEEELLGKVEKLRQEKEATAERLIAAGGTPPKVEGGNGHGVGKAIEQATEDQVLAEAFNRMSLAARVKLLTEKPQVWERMLRTVESEGIAQLFRRGR